MFRLRALSKLKPMLPSGPHRFTFFKRLTPRSYAVAGLVTALLGLFWWLAISAAREKSQTSDELPHLAAGYAFDRFGDFRIQPENGNLPQRLYGLPGLAAEAKFPMDAERWRVSQYWQLAWDYFYSLDNPIDRILQQARGLNALFGVALGLLIFLLARARFGVGGGLLALGFYVFAPNFLTHSALATSDMSAAFFLALAPWLFWRHLQKRDVTSGVLAGLASGLTLVAKYNGLLLAPIYAVLLVADAWLRVDSTAPATATSSGIGAVLRARARRFAANFGLATLQGAAGVFTIWAFFNFRFSARGPGMPELIRFSWRWDEMLPLLGIKGVLIETALRWHLMPEAWLYGLSNVLAGENSRPAFFAGEHSQQGWWQFFPALFIFKSTLGVLGAWLLAVGVGLWAWLKSGAADRRAALTWGCPLLVTTVVIGFVSLRSHLNIGDRHILALYPALFIGLGALARHRVVAVAAVALLAAHIGASMAIRPHYMASFNRLAGGPDHAYRLFVDSSLDWGQDLPTLRTWLSAHRQPGEPFYLGYFGNAWPPHYGVRPNQFLPAVNYIVRPPHTPYEFSPGLYCVSATLLAEVYSIYRGQWTPAMEAHWQRFRAVPPSAEKFEEYDLLRFARLCKFLQRREPEATAGYSILIYRLTAADLQAALEGPVTGAYRLRTL